MKTICAALCPLIVATLCGGCASYKAVSLPPLQPEFAPYVEENDGVIVACKAFSKADCKRYLDRDVISKGYQPVQVTVKNETKKYVVFSEQGVSLPCVPAEEVAQKVHTNTAGRATVYGVGALFLWPLAVPAIVDGVGSSKANQQLNSDFAAKSADQTVIQPYSTLNGLIFIPSQDYQERFTITLFDRENRQKMMFRLSAQR